MTLLIDGPRALLAGLIDYAGIFPPASLPLEAAVAEYRSARSGDEAWMLGRFLATTSTLEELAGVLTESMVVGETPWPIGAIVDEAPGPGALHAQVFDRHMSPAARVETVELRLSSDASDGRSEREAYRIVKPVGDAAITISGEVIPFFEVAIGDGWERGVPTAVAAVASLKTDLLRKVGAKLRTGGTEPDAVPTPEQVARFIVSCHSHGLAFKATAGLHQPVRHWDDQLGAMRHGFLNLLAAAAIAQRGGDEHAVTAALAEEDPAAFGLGASGLRLGDERYRVPILRSMRTSMFTAYGSCSFDEPLDGLRALGLL